MAIAFDASTTFAITVSGSSNFVPTGTPRGIFVFVVENNGSADVVSAVTYGGVSMTKVLVATDAVGEPGQCYAFFLGSAIPTGTQSVSVTVTSGSTTKRVGVLSVTAASDTRLAGTGSGKVEGDTTNPSVTITGISGASFGASGIFSGNDATTDVLAGTGMTEQEAVDFGTTVACWETSTTQNASGNLTIAWAVSVSNDTAMVALAIEEFTLTSIKTLGGLAYASVKTIGGLATSSVKTLSGLA